MNPYMLAGLLGLGLMGRRGSDALASPPISPAPIPAQAFPVSMPSFSGATAFPVQGSNVPSIPMYPDEFYQDPNFLKFAEGMQGYFNAPPSEVQMRTGISPEMYGAETIGTPSNWDNAQLLATFPKVGPEAYGAETIGTASVPNLGMLGGLGSSLLRQAQGQPDLPAGRINPGNPRSVNYSSLIDLLAPKRTAQRKLSLL
jgi:hypothetical protein